MGTGDLCRVPLAAVHPGRARQCSGTGPCGYCRRVLWVPACGVSIRGKFVLSRNPGYKTRGVAMWLNVVLTPGNLPRNQCSGTGPSASCGHCCPLCPAGVQYSEKIRFIEPQGINGHRRPMPGAPSSGTSRENQAMFRDGTVWVL